MKKIERRAKGVYNAICSFKMDHWTAVAEDIYNGKESVIKKRWRLNFLLNTLKRLGGKR